MKEGEPKFEDNNKEEENKRKSGISKVVGVDSIQEQEIQQQLQNVFENQSEVKISGELLKDYEQEKTDEEKEIIDYILEKIPEFIRDYGGTFLNVTADHIHILDKEKIGEEEKKKLSITRENGGYNWQNQTIYLLEARRDSKLLKTQMLVHEILHFVSFQSIEITEKGKRKINIRRLGIEIGSKRKREIYFEDINEAITEELVKRFDEKYFEGLSILHEELKHREGFRKNKTENTDDISNLEIVKEIGPGNFEAIGYRYAYEKERQYLNEIIENIYKNNPEEFNTKEEVFKIFGEAAMSGKLLKIARLIEKTYGKGSFRILGEETQRKND